MNEGGTLVAMGEATGLLLDKLPLGVKDLKGLMAWIDKNKDRNEREIHSVTDLARRHSNVNGIIVGNETIFRGEQKADDLIQMIQRVS